ncbi:MAG TPA: hypothetical protein VKA34_07375 [Balneolales bacterium]|nr:hypothetical protein [Balneolales bacterium]
MSELVNKGNPIHNGMVRKWGWASSYMLLRDRVMDLVYTKRSFWGVRPQRDVGNEGVDPALDYKQSVRSALNHIRGYYQLHYQTH